MAVVQGHWQSPAIFLGYYQGDESEVQQPGHEPVSIGDVGIIGKRLACYTTEPAPTHSS